MFDLDVPANCPEKYTLLDFSLLSTLCFPENNAKIILRYRVNMI